MSRKITRRTGLPTALMLAPALVAVGVLAACGTTDGTQATTTPEPDALPLEDTSWGLVSYAGEGGSATEVPDGVTATALFADGTVSGSGGCNRFTGPYELDGDALSIGPLASTLMACVEPQGSVEQAYLAALEQTAGYQTDASTLELLDDAGDAVLTFEVVEPLSLTGTEWTAVSVNTGTGAVSGLVGGVMITATFDEDGNVSGSAGCNSFSGTYTVDGDTIELGPLASTKKACAEDVMTQEAAFLAAMGNATTLTIDGDRLELRDDDGALQADFVAS
jgi:heat shock protein HslJ